MSTRTSSCRTRTSARLATAVLAAGLALPAAAQADPCAPLVNDLVAWVNAYPGNTVAFKWAMNYQANGRWTVNYGTGSLGKGKIIYLPSSGGGRPPFTTSLNIRFPALSGEATRTFSDRTFCRNQPGPNQFCTLDQNFDVRQAEKVALDIFSDGGVMVARQYGPTAAVCHGTKFLTINYWDGFDSFTFQKQTLPIIK